VSTARFSPNAYTLTISACFLVAIFLPHLLILRPWFRDSYSREIRDYGIVDTFGGSWLGGLTSLVLLGLFLPNYRFVERIAFGIIMGIVLCFLWALVLKSSPVTYNPQWVATVGIS